MHRLRARSASIWWRPSIFSFTTRVSSFRRETCSRFAAHPRERLTLGAWAPPIRRAATSAESRRRRIAGVEHSVRCSATPCTTASFKIAQAAPEPALTRLSFVPARASPQGRPPHSHHWRQAWLKRRAHGNIVNPEFDDSWNIHCRAAETTRNFWREHVGHRACRPRDTDTLPSSQSDHSRQHVRHTLAALIADELDVNQRSKGLP